MRTDVLALLVIGAICGIMAAATAVASSGPPSHGSGSYKETSSGTDDKHESDHKHTICHATGSESNPYVVITPSVSGVYHGHIAHQHSEDIIPPFTYKGKTYSQNWDAAGQTIYANGCRRPPVDVCPNIAGVQTSVPSGMIKDASGNCVTPPVDVCPNIDGIQTTIPPGMIKNSYGKCVTPPPTDVCPNIPGVQTTIPPGLIKDASGNCVTPPPTDVCPNIEGVQTSVPAGMVKDASGNCVTPPPTDECPNIDGIQTTVPAGMIKDASGNCVAPPPTDVCPNIEGVQTTVPVGMIKDASGNCVTPPGPAPALIDLMVRKVDTPDPVSAGRTLRYTITVTNRSSVRATGVIVEDIMPAGVRITSARASQGSCSAAGARITCRLGTLGAGASARVTIQAVPSTPGTIVNFARVHGNEPDPRPENNTTTETTRVVAPFQPPSAVCDTVTAGTRSIAVGTRTTLRIVVKGRGRAVVNARVRVRGAGIDATARTNRRGVAVVSVRATKRGIVTISVAGFRNCGRRIGAVDGGQPDLTG